MPTGITAAYEVSVLPGPHELEVAITFQGVPPGALHLELPTWVPGAYGFMRYARDLFEVRAEDSKGAALSLEREGWSGFRVEARGGTVRVRYRAAASDVSFGELAGIVEHHQAVLLGTRYLYAVGQVGPCTVRYGFPEGWAVHHAAGAKPVDARTFEYPSYAALLDAPVVAGQYDVVQRRSHGTTFHHVFLDRAVGYATERDGFLDGVMRVVDGAHGMFGSFPFEHYTFIYTFNPLSHWGLEHANATMIELGEQSLIDPGQRRDAIRVCAHELFHAWNVCRLKPAPLGKLDHARGSFPDALWVAEGFTRYYEFVLGSRANEITPEIFFSNILNYYRYLAAMPAYARVSAKDSSLATFLNHGKYPGSINNTVDYYDVGMLIAFDLDVLLRSQGRSLDADFRAFYEAYVGKGDGFTSADLRAFFADRMREAGALLESEVEGPGALSTVAKIESLGFEVERGQVRKIGIVLEKDKGPVIDNVLDTGPSANSGLAAGDEIIRVDGLAFHAPSLRWLIAHAEAITLEVKRGHSFFTFEVRPQAQEDLTGLVWRGTEAQAAAIRTWLGRDDFRPTPGQRFSIATYDNFHGVQTVI